MPVRASADQVSDATRRASPTEIERSVDGDDARQTGIASSSALGAGLGPKQQEHPIIGFGIALEPAFIIADRAESSKLRADQAFVQMRVFRSSRSTIPTKRRMKL